MDKPSKNPDDQKVLPDENQAAIVLGTCNSPAVLTGDNPIQSYKIKISRDKSC